MLADLTHAAELRLPPLTGAMAGGLADLYDHVVNPLDLGGMKAGIALFQPEVIRHCFESIGRDSEVDMLLLGLTTMPMVERNMEQVAEFARAWGKPVLVYSIIGRVAEPAVNRLRDAGIPIFASATAAVEAARALVDTATNAGRPWRAPERPAGIPGPGELSRTPLDLADGAAVDGLLRRFGLRLPAGEVVTSATAAATAAERLGGVPLALKVESRDIPHKTEAGGVRLGVTGTKAARRAFDEIIASVKRYSPGARIEGVLIQPMISGVEVLIGVSVDPNFGPLVAFGMGGIMVELLDDVALRPAPLSQDDAFAMIGSVRAARLLDGFRGSPPADRAALADALVCVSFLALDLADLVREIDLNPIAVLPVGQGVYVLDRLFVPRQARSGE